MYREQYGEYECWCYGVKGWKHTQWYLSFDGKKKKTTQEIYLPCFIVSNIRDLVVTQFRTAETNAKLK